MDLRAYYKKIREVESGLREQFVVLISHETPDGGKAGVRTQVPRHVASKLIVEGQARLATAEETQTFQDANLDAKHIADQLAAANRMQVMVIPANELRNPKASSKSLKEQG